MCILLVEDESLIRLMLAEELALAVSEPPTRSELETVAAQAVAEHLLDRPVD